MSRNTNEIRAKKKKNAVCSSKKEGGGKRDRINANDCDIFASEAEELMSPFNL